MTQAVAISSPADPALAPVTNAECRHCGLPVPRSRRDAFCCNGCERVYALLHESGLDRFYTLRNGAGIPVSEPREDRYAWLDADRAGSGALRLEVQGIHCTACVWLLESLFTRHHGALGLRINPGRGEADLRWDPDRGDVRDYLREVEQFGYRFGPRREGRTGSRGLALRLGLAAAIAGQAMMFSIAYYAGLAPQDGPIYRILGRLEVVLGAAAVIVGGSVFLRAAVLGLRRRILHLDLPIAAGILLAYGGSLAAYLRQGPEAAYFDTVAIFIALMLAGRWLQERVLERNRNALLRDAGIDNLFARVFVNGHLETVPAVSVRTGDELWVAPGDVVPTAAILLDEEASVSLEWISGESHPVSVDAGGAVPAGAFNVGDRLLRARAAEDFAASALRDLLESPPRDLVRDSGRWSRVARFYVLGVFTLAAAGFLAWLGRGVDRALLVAVSVLVVTCPCALGLAVPLAADLTQSALRRRGVFVLSPTLFDRLARVRRVVFDKTGTLTLGRLQPDVSTREALAALSDDDATALGNLVARSNHPVSRAVLAALPEAPVVDPKFTVTERPGFGLEGRFGGRVYRLGRPGFAGPGGGNGDAGTVFAVDATPRLRLGFEESFKENAAGEVARLHDAGIQVHLLSGDRPERVRDAAARLGIPPDRAEGSLTPDAKRDWIRAVDRGDTLMIGDGINDAPALAAAACSGTPAVDHPAVPARTDFHFLGDRLESVRLLLQAAGRFRTVVRGNLALALAYNAAALVLCFAGLVNPLVAAVLMPASSLAVVGLTVHRLSREKNPWTR